jgi:hypothetical protein
MSGTAQSFKVDLADSIQIEKSKFQKMVFIMNAVENGWSVKKINASYVFSKKHEGRREVFMESYLERFIESNIHSHAVI